MAVIRVNKTKNYTVMSNHHFKNRELSLKAKGLLSLILSLPDTWDYSIAGLVAICKESESSVVSALNELKNFGYLVVKKLYPNETKSGRIEYIYDIYEEPVNQGLEFQGVENQGVEVQGVENRGQLNTNQLNTNKSITKELNTKHIEELFDKFWEVYPKKIGKKCAYNSFKKIKNLDEEFDKIIQVIEDLKQSRNWQKNNGQFIPYPTTFLNQERWKDEEVHNNDPFDFL